jgi:uncharacterized membrane protein
MNPDPSDSLEKQMAALTSRVYRLEETLRNYGIALEQPEAPLFAGSAVPEQTASPLPAPTPEFAPRDSAEEVPPERPLFASSGPVSPADERSLESRIGSQWFNRVGILAVLIAMAWFLKLPSTIIGLVHWAG